VSDVILGTRVAIVGGGVQTALMNATRDPRFGHSFWGIVASLSSEIDPWFYARVAPTVYVIAAVAAFIAVAAFVVFVERDLWRRLAMLLIAGLTLPFMSYDYTLVHMLLPLMLVIGAPESEPDASEYVVLPAGRRPSLVIGLHLPGHHGCDRLPHRVAGVPFPHRRPQAGEDTCRLRGSSSLAAPDSSGATWWPV
jgi:hypothetical protein